ncbi:MAG TPA: class I SAM-dependent methyltransferase [Candidatus Angelobacter sp.]|nr:class I SAM-dependent methyltransferase [Candidatus Angelobacter sp.]
MSKAPTERFSDRVDNYIRYRPGYPAEVLEALRLECGLRPDHVIAEIASGTGIFTRLLLENGNKVFAVEPNAEMRAAGSQLKETYPNVVPVLGTAEETTLAAASVDFVVAAQAAHWFHPQKARAEFARILKPRGWCVLLWNERPVSGTSFLEDYEQLLHTYCPEYKEKRHGKTAVIVREFFGEGQYQERIFKYAQQFDLAGLTGRLLSSSYCPLEGDPNYAPMLRELARIFNLHARENKVQIDYETRVYFSQL